MIFLEYNAAFIENKEYENLITTKTPNAKAVLLTCMDTRLTELSTRALGFKMVISKLLKMLAQQFLIHMGLQCEVY